MPASRRLARAFALRGLYAHQFNSEDLTLIAAHLAEDPEFARADEAFFRTLLYGVTREREALEAAFAPCLDRPVAELSPIERAILALGAYEMQHLPDVPLSVVINEGIELAKAYGGTDGHKFVNGVLDRLGKLLRPLEAGQRRRPG